jgi:type 1 glutamine amidotransferase
MNYDPVFSALDWRSPARRLTACFLLLLAATLPGLGADAPPLKICLVSASAEYDSDASLAAFQKYLESHYQVVCTRAFGKDKGESLPGLEALDTSDLMIVYTRRVTLPPAQLEHLRKFIAAGRPIIGLRTASHAFQNYMEFDREVLGGGYKGHYTNSQAEIKLAPGRSAHPVLAGVTPLNSRKLYKNPTLADDVVVLLEGTTLNNAEPVAWVREHNGGRVFYTSLGTQEDFTEESFRRLLVNAIFWTTQREVPASRRPASAAGQAP